MAQEQSGHSDSRELGRQRSQSRFGRIARHGLASRPRIRLLVGLSGLLLFTLLCGGALAYYGTDTNLAVGYSPIQPIELSHKLHAGDLGLDCRFCHFTVERSAFAALPSSEVCMKCHSKVRTDSVKLLAVRATFAENRPIQWVRVHNLPDFVYFDHSVHLSAGVGCSTCHGRIDQMQRVEQVQSLSMGWCIDCHRKTDLNTVFRISLRRTIAGSPFNFFPDTWKYQECTNEGRPLKIFMPAAMKTASENMAMHLHVYELLSTGLLIKTLLVFA